MEAYNSSYILSGLSAKINNYYNTVVQRAYYRSGYLTAV